MTFIGWGLLFIFVIAVGMGLGCYEEIDEIEDALKEMGILE